jgi:hypothetical protein
MKKKIFELKKLCLFCLALSLFCSAFAADVILNEYNAVGSDVFLNSGNASADSDGGRASDSFFGRVMGNGGDWFELIVITDHLDMRNWKLDIYIDGAFNETLLLTNHSIWSDLRSGTIITVSEDLPSDISYNPAAGDWWINVQANNSANGLYISPSNFAVNNTNWQLRIRNAGSTVMFGPAGEGVSPPSGVGDTEIFRLEATPNGSTGPNSPDYDSGGKLSTFGSANQWGSQDLHLLRSVAAGPSTITLLGPNGSEIMMGGTTHTITWSTTGTINNVLIEFSVDNGNNWSEVYPPNIGNTGSYDWLVPIVNSQQCKIRLTNTANLNVYDTTEGFFKIYECTLDGDLTGDCLINMNDFVIMASYWMQEANPYD